MLQNILFALVLAQSSAEVQSPPDAAVTDSAATPTNTPAVAAAAPQSMVDSAARVGAIVGASVVGLSGAWVGGQFGAGVGMLSFLWFYGWWQPLEVTHPFVVVGGVLGGMAWLGAGVVLGGLVGYGAGFGVGAVAECLTE